MSEENVVQTLDVASGNIVESVPTREAPASPPAQNPANSEARTPTQVEGGGVPGKNWHARKIDELTRTKYEQEREIARLQGIAQGLYTGKQEPAKPAPPAAPVNPEIASHPGFDPSDPEPDKSTFDDYEKYLRTVARWESRLERRAGDREGTQRRQVESQQHEVMRETVHIAQRFEADRERFVQNAPDYNEVVDSLQIDAQKAPEMAKAIFRSDRPTQILYALGKHPQVAYNIAAMPPHQQIRAIAQIEARLQMPSAPISNAPPPGSSVGSGRATSRTSYRDDFTPDEHLAWKRANGIK